MEIAPPPIEIVNSIGHLADELGARSEKIADVHSSPRFHSIMLFRRLRSNLRAYMLLYQDGMSLECDILLRCIVEATICLAANAAMGDEFVKLLRSDAAATLKGSIKVWQNESFGELVRGGEKHLRNVFGHVDEDGAAHQILKWSDLATRGGFPRLYSTHKMLSAASAHITGLSLMRGIVDADGSGEEDAVRLDNAARTVNFVSMVEIVSIACRIHARMIEAEDLLPHLDTVDAELRVIAA